jgi:hypothetical protein
MSTISSIPENRNGAGGLRFAVPVGTVLGLGADLVGVESDPGLSGGLGDFPVVGAWVERRCEAQAHRRVVRNPGERLRPEFPVPRERVPQRKRQPTLVVQPARNGHEQGLERDVAREHLPQPFILVEGYGNPLGNGARSADQNDCKSGSEDGRAH